MCTGSICIASSVHPPGAAESLTTYASASNSYTAHCRCIAQSDAAHYSTLHYDSTARVCADCSAICTCTHQIQNGDCWWCHAESIWLAQHCTFSCVAFSFSMKALQLHHVAYLLLLVRASQSFADQSHIKQYCV
jgi:hypothetical protein